MKGRGERDERGTTEEAHPIQSQPTGTIWEGFRRKQGFWWWKEAPSATSPSALSRGSLQEHYGQAEIRTALFGDASDKDTLHELIAGELESGNANLGAASPDGAGIDAMGSAAVGRVLDKTYDSPVEAVADLRSDGGQPLPTAIRQQAERAMGHAFTGVRLHTDSNAALAGMGANAAADGNHIHIDQAQVDLTTAKGKGILFHELTHVAQAREGRLPQHGVTSDRGMETEIEARRVGTQLAGQSALGDGEPSSPEATQMSHILAETTSAIASSVDWDGQASTAEFDTGWSGLVDSVLGGGSAFDELGVDASVDVGPAMQTRAEGSVPEAAPDSSSSTPVMLNEVPEHQLGNDFGMGFGTPDLLAPPTEVNDNGYAIHLGQGMILAGRATPVRSTHFGEYSNPRSGPKRTYWWSVDGAQVATGKDAMVTFPAAGKHELSLQVVEAYRNGAHTTVARLYQDVEVLDMDAELNAAALASDSVEFEDARDQRELRRTRLGGGALGPQAAAGEPSIRANHPNPIPLDWFGQPNALSLNADGLEGSAFTWRLDVVDEVVNKASARPRNFGALAGPGVTV